jgi:alcohol dehydrogenase class IV
VTAAAFRFATAARVLFGAGRAAELPALVAEHGGRAFVCTGAHPERHAGLVDDFSVPGTTFAVPGEPTAELAAEAVRAARAFQADVVVGMSGGSVLDLGKAVAALLGKRR